jgi:hypothetical protein
MNNPTILLHRKYKVVFSCISGFPGITLILSASDLILVETLKNAVGRLQLPVANSGAVISEHILIIDIGAILFTFFLLLDRVRLTFFS